MMSSQDYTNMAQEYMDAHPEVDWTTDHVFFRLAGRGMVEVAGHRPIDHFRIDQCCCGQEGCTW